eukprot:289085_1
MKIDIGSKFMRYFDGLSTVLKYNNSMRINYQNFLSNYIIPSMISLDDCYQHNKYPSNVSEDHTPFEFSVKLSNNFNQNSIRFVYQPDNIECSQSQAANSILAYFQNHTNIEGISLKDYDVNPHLTINNWFHKYSNNTLINNFTRQLNFDTWLGFDLNPCGTVRVKTYYEASNCWNSLTEMMKHIQMGNYLSPLDCIRHGDIFELFGFSIDLMNKRANPRVKIYSKFDLESIHELFGDNTNLPFSETDNDLIKPTLKLVQDNDYFRNKVRKKVQIAYFYNMNNNQNDIIYPDGFTLYIPLDTAFENDEITMNNIINILNVSNYNTATKYLIQRMIQTCHPTHMLNESNGLFQYLALNSKNDCSIY